MSSVPDTLVGVALGCASLAVFIFASIVLLVLLKGGFLRSRQSTFYVLIFANIAVDVVTTGILAFHLSPSIILQDWIFIDGAANPLNTAVGVLGHVTWYQTMISQIVMAFNRLAVVVVPSWSIVSKRRHVVGVTVAVFPVCIALALLADVFLPCCTLYYYYGRYGLKYIGEGRNYANEFISLPINVVCSSASIVCYVIIFAYVWKTKSRVTDSINDKSRSAIRKREVRYALQFALLTLFLLFEWVSVRIFPKIVPPEVPQLYVVTTFLLLAHNLSNSLVLVTMNKEFKVAFWKLLVPSNKPTTTHISSTMMPTWKHNFAAG